ncbi:hypothetical protein ABFS82_01G088500 [Erythranthe guttata]
MKNILHLCRNLFFLCILLSSMITNQVSSSGIIRPSTKKYHASEYIQNSCKKTLYPDLCNKSLAKYSTKIKTNPKTLTIAALLVAFNTTQSTYKILKNLSRNRALNPGEKSGLLECVEEVSDSVYELQKSFKELFFSRKGPKFELQMNDIQTWVSAALTDDDTCMDDFRASGRMKILVRGLVLRIARLSSIALSFINMYAGV